MVKVFIGWKARGRMRRSCVGSLVVFWMVLSCLGAEVSQGGVLPRVSRLHLNRLLKAQEAVQQGRLAEAIPIFEQLLTAPESGYVPVEGAEGLYVPLKQAAAMMLQSLPPEGRAMFEAWCAGRAARRLADALTHRDRQELLRIVQDYPGTGISAQAALLLAMDAWARGLAEQALYWGQKVLSYPIGDRSLQSQAWLLIGVSHQRAGRLAEARQAIQQALALSPQGQVRIGGQVVAKDKALQELIEGLAAGGSERQPSAAGVQSPSPPQGDWPIVRGDASRNKSADHWPGRADTLLWDLDLEEQEEIKNITETMGRMGVGGPFGVFSTPIPASQPIGVGRLALVRLPFRLVAIDVLTGRQQWEYPWGGDAQGLPRIRPPVGGKIIFAAAAPRGYLISQRIFDDSLYGQMAASGNRLFIVDIAGEVREVIQSPFPAALPSSPGMRTNHNRLVCLDIAKEGKVLWMVGGRSGEDEPALAGAFFLGPPLPLEGRLYVLVEQQQQIFVAALAEQTGQLLWLLPIAAPERGIAWEPRRRLAGAPPSYANGVLICPTSGGAIVAVDPWQPAVLWAYENPLADSVERRLMANRLSMLFDAEHISIDSNVLLVDNYVLTAPVESEEVFCLELASGRLCWRRNIRHFRFLAGVAEGVVLTVGSRTVNGWQLRSGKPAWDDINLPLPDGFFLAGRGFRKGRTYYLPIFKQTQSELLAIDIPTGRFEQRLALPTEKRIGNVTPMGCGIVSFSHDGLQAFGATENR